MLMTIIIALIILLIIVLAIRYIYKIRKTGGCVGCAESEKGNCSCSATFDIDEEEVIAKIKEKENKDN